MKLSWTIIKIFPTTPLMQLDKDNTDSESELT
jgi:hypothetical protein